jgi:hypothetical protein
MKNWRFNLYADWYQVAGGFRSRVAVIPAFAGMTSKKASEPERLDSCMIPLKWTNEKRRAAQSQ